MRAEPPALAPDAALARAGQLHNAGDWDAAERIYREVLERNPNEPRALFLLGMLAFQRDDLPRARDLFMRATEHARDVGIYHLWLARCLRALSQLDAALLAARRARVLEPASLQGVETEALVLFDQRQLESAERLLVDTAPRFEHCATYWGTLGRVHLEQARLDAAQHDLERALGLDPQLLEAQINLAVTLHRKQQPHVAIAMLERICALHPDAAEAHFNLACVLQGLGALDAAIGCCRRALALRPREHAFRCGLASLLTEVAELDEASALYRQLLPRGLPVQEHSSYVALSQYCPPEDPADLARIASAFGALHAPTALAGAPRRIAAPRHARALRVGYVSADFREHSVSYFFAPLLQAHDPARVEVTCYNDSERRDAVTERIERLARFVNIAGHDDAAVATRIREDGIDILVDLAGHTVGQRLTLFAHAAAPIQITYLGYPGTTGVAAIAYRLTDARVDPPAHADDQYTERLVRLPRVFCCFEPPPSAPDVGPLPAAANGCMTFGSLSNYTKLGPATLLTWARVLRALPDSRLILQSGQFGDDATQRRALARLEQHGIARERVQLLGPLKLEAHLAIYRQLDIALDTHPWNGHTTTCLSLHMGVPVITLAGRAGAGRMGASVLSAAGLDDWIAGDEDQYLALALRWAQDRPALAILRSELRSRLQASALCDATRFAREVEDAYEMLHARAQADVT